MSIVIDYSWHRFTPAELRAMDVVGVVRYLAPGTSGKIIHQPEWDLLQDGKIPIALIWEIDELTWTEGRPQGLHDGERARQMATALGHPTTRPICTAIDSNVFPEQIDKVIEYVGGFEENCGPTGVYGTAYVIDMCVGAGVASYGYQTNARGWYDNRRQSGHAVLQQHLSVDGKYDPNDILAPDWGQYPEPEEPVTDAEMDEIARRTVALFKKEAMGKIDPGPPTVKNAVVDAIREHVKAVFLKDK